MTVLNSTPTGQAASELVARDNSLVDEKIDQWLLRFGLMDQESSQSQVQLLDQTALGSLVYGNDRVWDQQPLASQPGEIDAGSVEALRLRQLLRRALREAEEADGPEGG